MLTPTLPSCTRMEEANFREITHVVREGVNLTLVGSKVEGRIQGGGWNLPAGGKFDWARIQILKTSNVIPRVKVLPAAGG